MSSFIILFTCFVSTVISLPINTTEIIPLGKRNVTGTQIMTTIVYQPASVQLSNCTLAFCQEFIQNRTLINDTTLYRCNKRDECCGDLVCTKECETILEDCKWWQREDTFHYSGAGVSAGCRYWEKWKEPKPCGCTCPNSAYQLEFGTHSFLVKAYTRNYYSQMRMEQQNCGTDSICRDQFLSIYEIGTIINDPDSPSTNNENTHHVPSSSASQLLHISFNVYYMNYILFVYILVVLLFGF